MPRAMTDEGLLRREPDPQGAMEWSSGGGPSRYQGSRRGRTSGCVHSLSSVRDHTAKKFAPSVNKEVESLLHWTDALQPKASVNNALLAHARGCAETGVKFVPIARNGGARTLGLGCKGGVGDGYGCAHHLTLEEGAHVRP